MLLEGKKPKEELRTLLMHRFDTLKADKAVQTADNQAISDLIYPLGQLEASKQSESEKTKRDKIVENIGQVATEDLAAFIGSTIAPDGQRWLRLTVKDPTNAKDKETKRILDDVARRVLHFLEDEDNKFQMCLDESLVHNVAFGLGIPHVQEDGNNLVFTSVANDEAYLQENNKDYPDVILRLRRMTAKQILEEYVYLDDELQSHDLDEVAIGELKEQAEKDPKYLFDVVYGTFPKSDGICKLSDKFAENYKYYTFHMFRDGDLGKRQGVLRQSGFNYQPYFPFRFRRSSNQAYGVGCGHRALSDIRTLQVFKKSNIATSLLASRPPFDIPWQTYAKNRLNISPGAANHRRRTARGKDDKAEPLFLVGNVPVSVEMADRVLAAIFRAFYLDKIQESKVGEMSATESNIRARDRIQAMTPNLTRIINEFFTPAIKTVIDFMFDKKMFDREFTKEMKDDITIIYVNFALRAQMDTDLLAFQNLSQTVLSLSQAFPRLQKQLEEDAVMPYLVDKYFLPHDFIKAKEKVQAEVDQEQQIALAGASRDQSQAFLNTAKAAGELGI